MFTVINGQDMNKPQAKPKTRRSGVRQFLRHPLWAPLNQRSAWDRLATAVNPLWSLIEARARVEKIVDEAPGVKSLWLKTNARFKGFVPGQHVLLELEINGARHARCFSFSNAPRVDFHAKLTQGFHPKLTHPWLSKFSYCFVDKSFISVSDSPVF